MKFYLWMKQRGEGCDYTIGCANKLVELFGAEDIQQARLKAGATLEYYGIDGDERDLTEALIVSAVENAMPLVNAHVLKKVAEREEYEREKKRRELERLKRELGE